METLSASELVALAKQRGLSTNQRTLRLYVDMGLIPKPDVRSREEGGRSSYYDPRVIRLLASISTLQGQGHTLKAIKGFLDSVESIARRTGEDPVESLVRASEAISGISGERRQTATAEALSDTALWRLLGGPVVAEMLRRGIRPDIGDVAELRVAGVTKDGQEFSAPVFLDPASVAYRAPAREDDEELGRLTSSCLSELSGRPEPPASAESIRGWLEETYDMSRSNLILARRQALRSGTATPVTKDGAQAEATRGPALGFVALGVEPERIRAGQVRLEGPYVVPEYRGQGLGRELLSRAECLARSLGATYVDAFVDSQARLPISFLRRFGFSPDHFGWEARAKLPAVLPSGEDPLGGKSRLQARLEIRQVTSPADLEQALAVDEEARKGTPGYYRAKAEDLTSWGATFPMEGHFNAYLDGELMGAVWNSAPSPRVYAVVLPRYSNTWIEKTLWRYILRYLRGKGKKEARTEVISDSASGRKVVSQVGFVPDRLIVCYRKRLDGGQSR